MWRTAYPRDIRKKNLPSWPSQSESFLHIFTKLTTVSTMDRPDVLFIGHSFIRRARDFLITPESGKPHGRDISESRPHIPRIAAAKAELAHGVRGLYTAAQGINLVAYLWKGEPSVMNIHPAIIVMHVGSNDLSHIVDPQAASALADSVIEFGLRLHSEFGVQTVIFNLAVPRDSHNMSTDADTFLQCMTNYNATLRQESELHQALIFNHLRGFYKRKVNNQDQPLPVASWSSDGIHCNLQYMKNTSNAHASPSWEQLYRWASCQARESVDWLSAKLPCYQHTTIAKLPICWHYLSSLSFCVDSTSWSTCLITSCLVIYSWKFPLNFLLYLLKSLKTQ